MKHITRTYVLTLRGDERAIPDAHKLAEYINTVTNSQGEGVIAELHVQFVQPIPAAVGSAIYDLLTTVEACGGLLEFTDSGWHAPAGDSEWVDLGEAVLNLQIAAAQHGLPVPLTVKPAEEQ